MSAAPKTHTKIIVGNEPLSESYVVDGALVTKWATIAHNGLADDVRRVVMQQLPYPSANSHHAIITITGEEAARLSVIVDPWQQLEEAILLTLQAADLHSDTVAMARRVMAHPKRLDVLADITMHDLRNPFQLSLKLWGWERVFNRKKPLSEEK